MIVTSAWLAQHLDDPNLVLLHVGTKDEYAAGHIPGARPVSVAEISISGPSGNALEMPPADDLRSRLERLGISDNSRVVVYYGKDWVSPTDARDLHARLRRARRSRVAARRRHGGVGRGPAEVTTDVPATRNGTLAPLKIQPDRRRRRVRAAIT